METRVFSTYVEVILSLIAFLRNWFSFLHVCGGDPEQEREANHEDLVFSTYVEVILNPDPTFADLGSFLHVCGGDPAGGVGYGRTAEFSPRMWRWSYSLKFNSAGT